MKRVAHTLLIGLLIATAYAYPRSAQAKECWYVVTVAVVNAQGEQFLLEPLPGPWSWQRNYGNIALPPGAIVRVINGKMGLGTAGFDCDASLQRNGMNVTGTWDGSGNKTFNCSDPGSYSGGATYDVTGMHYVFTIVAANQNPVLHQLRLGCILSGTAAAPGNTTMVRNLFTVPCTEPYTAMGYPPSGNGSEIVDGCADLFAQTNVIDWVHIDILQADAPYDPVVSMNGLLHADHWITSIDGVSRLTFTAPPGNYRIRIAHRNHLASITDHGVPFTGAPLSVSFKQYVLLGGMFLVLAPPRCGGQSPSMLGLGNANGDQRVSYVGAGNDRDPILVRVGGSVPTNSISGYYLEDVNMDGAVRYVGANNDRDPILQMIGGSTPTNVVLGQVP